MRRLRLFLFLLPLTLLTFPAHAQWQGTGPVTTDDDVGIGTASPSVPLHVNAGSTIGGWGGTLSNAWIQLGSDMFIDPNEIYSRETFHVGTLNERDVLIGTNGETRLSVASTGEVAVLNRLAVGLNSSSADFHVSRETGSTLAVIEADPNNQTESDNPRLRFQQDGDRIQAAIGLEGNGGDAATGTQTNGFYLVTKTDPGGQKTPLQLGTGDAMHLTIGGQGNVGIGTPSPSEKLSVNGKVRSKEVIVENSNWPDFVFEPGYDLRSLDAVDAFVDANGHLPGVPNASDVAQSGQHVGATQATLLQKIEELTLYAIDQHERAEQLADALAIEREQNAEQEHRLQSQQEQINRLQTQVRQLLQHLQAASPSSQSD